MAGIGSYEKGKAFALKSGNKPSFKGMGSSPVKTGDHSTPDPVDGHQHLTDEQKLTAAYRRKDESISRTMSKYNIDKKKATEIWNKQSGETIKIIKKKSPAKTHDGTKSSTTHYKDGSPKSKREVAFSERYEGEVAKSPTTNYQNVKNNY